MTLLYQDSLIVIKNFGAVGIISLFWLSKVVWDSVDFSEFVQKSIMQAHYGWEMARILMCVRVDSKIFIIIFA